MAEGFGIQGTPSVQSGLPGVGSQAAESASNLPKAPQGQRPQQATNAAVSQPTTFTSEPAVSTPVHSKIVSRLIEQGATVHSPGLARVPLPPRPEGIERKLPKKPAGPMTAPRALEGGMSPLASSALWDARTSLGAIGTVPTDTPGEP